MSKNETFSFEFQAEVKHVATSGKLVAYDGRKNGGVDMYLNLQSLVDTFGGLPENVNITVTVEASGALVDDAMAVVPRTMQNRFEESKAMFSDIYGMGLADYIAELSEEAPAKPAKASKARTVKPAKASKARTVKAAPASKARTVKESPEPVVKAAKGTRRTAPASKPAPGTAPASPASSLVERVAGLENGLALILAKLEGK